jgi:Family of unknown function (DUF6364)
MSKLTLHVPEELVCAAKNEAASRRVSVSKLVSDYFACLAANSARSTKDAVRDLAPRTRRLAGCIPNADMEDYIDYLERKHS